MNLSLTALRVADLERSQRFWVEGCGLPLRQTFSTPAFDAAIVGHDGSAGLELVREHKGEQEAGRSNGGFWKIVLTADDAEAAGLRAVANGGTMVMEAKALEHLGGLVLAMVRDPDGYLVELVQNPT